MGTPRGQTGHLQSKGSVPIGNQQSAGSVVERSELLPEATETNEAVKSSASVIPLNLVLKREPLEQRTTCDLPRSHHASISRSLETVKPSQNWQTKVFFTQSVEIAHNKYKSRPRHLLLNGADLFLSKEHKQHHNGIPIGIPYHQ